MSPTPVLIRYAEIRTLMISEPSIAAICRQLSRSHRTIAPKVRKIQQAMDAAGESLPPCPCGQPKFHNGGCTFSMVTRTKLGTSGRVRRLDGGELERRLKRLCQPEELRALIASEENFDAIVAKLGRSRNSVGPVIRKMLGEMEAEGIAPLCACGKLKFHPGGCAATKREDWQAPRLEMLRSGATVMEVQRAFGGGRTEIARLRDQAGIQAKTKGAGSSLRASRKPRPLAVPFVPIRPEADPLYSRISAMVPHWTSEQTRKDIISEIYVAILAGTISEAEAAKNIKRFVNAGFRTYENKFGPRSLDEALTDDSETSWVAMIPDPAALDAFDRLDDIIVGQRSCVA